MREASQPLFSKVSIKARAVRVCYLCRPRCWVYKCHPASAPLRTGGFYLATVVPADFCKAAYASIPTRLTRKKPTALTTVDSAPSFYVLNFNGILICFSFLSPAHVFVSILFTLRLCNGLFFKNAIVVMNLIYSFVLIIISISINH